jgi:ubiquinone/menaquinone biosynthesis C-methylase UbiE
MVTATRSILEARLAKNNVTKVYQKIAPFYDLWGKHGETKARQRCLELASIRDGESVLEVAVGTGLTFVEILKANPHGRIEGIDLTEAMLTKATEKARRTGLTNYRLRVGDAYQLDYPDHTFDVVINNYMFDLLPEQDFKTVLGEFKRVLRPSGRLAMVNMTLHERWYKKFIEYVYQYVYQVNPAWVGGCRGVYLLPYLEAAGFKNLTREFISQMMFPSEVVYGEVC